MLRVLTLSTLFPDATRPNFGVFVERQTRALAAIPDTAVTVVAPIGLPPPPFDRLNRYDALREVPTREVWKGLTVYRPRFVALPLTGGRWHAPALSFVVANLLPWIQKMHAPQVIDASFFFPDGVAAMMSQRRHRLPVSIKARGADIHHWGRARATARQVVRAGRAADGLLAVSAAMRDDMIALGMPAERIRVHHTGVDQDRFAPGDRAALKAALGVAGPLIVSTGALIPRKGHEVVVRALASLPGATLMIAGEGPERARLEALAAGTGVADRVRLLGSVPHAELPRLLAAADVMALASASEGLANAWVEALSSGTPIVITDAGGAREVVTSPVAGRIVAPEPAAFAHAIKALLDDPSAPDQVRATVRDFTWEANALVLRDHLADLVRRFGKGVPRHAAA
ncbi:MAG TPA: glycosyltransferase [Sphingomonas sp.]|jgi:glycosyltransferase involved in cell wall biosynthesis